MNTMMICQTTLNQTYNIFPTPKEFPIKLQIFDNGIKKNIACFNDLQVADINTTYGLKNYYINSLSNRQNNLNNADILYGESIKTLSEYKSLLNNERNTNNLLNDKFIKLNTLHDNIMLKYNSLEEEKNLLHNQKEISDYKLKIAKRDKFLITGLLVIAISANFL